MQDLGEWRSLVAHAVWDRGVAGSNPVSPTIAKCLSKAGVFCYVGRGGCRFCEQVRVRGAQEAMSELIASEHRRKE